MAAGLWLVDTRGLSSGFLEMQAILNVLRSINADGLLNGERVLLHTDSQVADTVLRKGGSMAADIEQACFIIFWYCLENKIN